jgi:hypothetical protein
MKGLTRHCDADNLSRRLHRCGQGDSRRRIRQYEGDGVGRRGDSDDRTSDRSSRESREVAEERDGLRIGFYTQDERQWCSTRSRREAHPSRRPVRVSRLTLGTLR